MSLHKKALDLNNLMNIKNAFWLHKCSTFKHTCNQNIEAGTELPAAALLLCVL